ncbi:leucyl-tRNA--protein transferase [Thiomicrospira aerophila AL3]|uniref:Leucyl/phenylalanyl-tRNA--protein transferase n=1 Tax=Thiomicrospira aerophila AL3 TaxID=717772 RepID=W0DRT6_9GAMM|nr:leucyl/phenylalanyl-tRNA--protein transferase [Thiomicrospira aerophila]AHF01152.1 leucyl-tRNA--protein transferase [Thiomicrospira aerophila AL3]
MSKPWRSLDTHLPAWLEDGIQQPFPPSSLAFDDPPGLLALSSRITVDLLRQAYPRGIFPWSADDEPVTWWSPEPRAVLYTSDIKIRRSLRQAWRQQPWQISFNQALPAVLDYCAKCPRPGQDGTWLRQDLQAGLLALHQQGHVHSVEVWLNEQLVGGLYGLSFGQMFFGESMFSLVPNSSKLALVALASHLQHWGWPLIDCQVASDHLMSMGAIELSRTDFERQLKQQIALPDRSRTVWQIDPTLLNKVLGGV